MKDIGRRLITRILTWEAQILLRRHTPRIIAVTGSVGKTSMKDAIYAAVRDELSVRKSEKSFNSELGVPLTVLGLPNAWNNPFLWLKNLVDGLFIALLSREYPDVLVLETGVDRPGDMQSLTGWLLPDVVVLTRLPTVPVHVEFFKDPDAVVAEKLTLVAALKSDGILVYNNDDEIIKRHLPEVRQSAIGYGRYLPTHFTAGADEVIYHDNQPVGMRFTLTHLEHTYPVEVRGVVGLQPVYTTAGAIATAVAFGVSPEAAIRGVGNLMLPPGRMRLLSGIKGTTIIDDSYNSSPIAAESALLTLKELKYAKRKIAVLGDMLELGRYSAREHERVGELAAAAADVVITIGVRARSIATSALMHGVHESNVLQYDDPKRAGRELQALMQAGDIILVKASQGIRAERLVEEVMQEPEQATTLLPRQDPAWKRR